MLIESHSEWEPVFCVRNRSKWQCHEIFCIMFFSRNIFLKAPENNIRVISIFFENSRRYSQVMVHHRNQRHHGKFATAINDTGGKFSTGRAGVGETGGKEWEQ